MVLYYGTRIATPSNAHAVMTKRPTHVAFPNRGVVVYIFDGMMA